MATQQKKSAFEQALNWVTSKTASTGNTVAKTTPTQNNQSFYKDFSRGYDNFVSAQQTKPQVNTQGEQFDRFNTRLRAGLNNVTNKVKQALTTTKVIGSDIKKTLPIAIKRTGAQMQTAAGLTLDSIENAIQDTPVNGTVFDKLTGGRFMKDPITLRKITNNAPLVTDKFSDNLIKSGEENIKKADIEAQKTLDPLKDEGFLKNIQNPKWLARNLTLNAPSFISSLGIGAAVSFLTKNPAVGFSAAFGPSYLQNAGDMYADAKQNGADEKTARSVSKTTGVVLGLLDSFGVSSLLEKFATPALRETAKKLVFKEIVFNLAKNSVQEGGTESVQQIIQNSVAKVYYDHQRDIFAGVPEAGFLGGVMGGVGSVGTDVAINALQSKQAPTNVQNEPISVPVEESVVAPVILPQKPGEGITSAEDLDLAQKALQKNRGYEQKTEAMVPTEEDLSMKALEDSRGKSKPKEYTVFRGEGGDNPASQADSYGKGTYYSMDKDFASQFGTVTESNVSFENPLVLKNQADLQAATDQMAEGGFESLADMARAKGYDGIVDEAAGTVISLKEKQQEITADPSSIEGQAQQEAVKKSKTVKPTGDVKKRGHVETVQADETTPQAIKEAVGESDDAFYQSITNKETVEKAIKEVANNYDETYKQIMDEDNLNIDKDPALFIAKALVLSKKAIAEGNNALAESIIIKAAEKGTKLGQGVQAFALWNKLTPEGVLKFAIQEAAKADAKLKDSASRQLANKWFGGNKEKIEISPETRDEIITRMKDIQTMPDGPEKLDALRQVMETIGKELPPTFSELIDAFRYQNILSNPLTHLRNIFGNTTQFLVIRPATLLADAGLDFIHAMVDPNYQAVSKFSDVPLYTRKGVSSIMKASEAFMSKVRGEGTINQPDLHSIRSSNIPKALRFVPNLLEGADTFFTTLVSTGEQAVLESQGMSSQEAAIEASKRAERLLFRNDIDPHNKTGQGHLLTSIDKFTNLVYKFRKGPASWFIPFIKTPMNVAKSQIEYSPLGILTTLGASNKKQQFAKAAVGSAVFVWGATMAMAGQTTWAAPTDEKEKELFYAQGKRPYSVLVPTPWGERWVPFQYFGVTGLALAIPAAMKQVQDRSKTALSDTQIEKATKMVAEVSKYFLAGTYMQGIGNFQKLAEGDLDFALGPNMAFVAQQAEPLSGLVTYVSRVIDPIYRKAGTFAEGIQRNTPILSTYLEPYLTPEGIPAERQQDISMAGIPLRSANVLPYGLGLPDHRYDAAYEAELKRKQTNNVTNKLKETLIKNIRSGNVNATGSDSVKLKTAGELLEQSLTSSAKEASKQGLSEGSIATLKRSGDFTYIRELLNKSEELGLTPELVKSELERKGVTTEEFEYDNQTLLPVDIKVEEIQNGVEGLEGNELLAKLVSYRKVSEGSRKMLLTDVVIGELVDVGLISKNTGAYLKKVQWDEKNNTFKEISSGGGGKGTSFKVSVPSAKQPSKIKISGPPKTTFKPLKVQSAKGLKTAKPKFQPANIKIAKTPAIPKIRAGVKSLRSLGRVR